MQPMSACASARSAGLLLPPRGQQLLQARGDTLARVSRGFVSPLDHRHGYRISLRSVTEPIDDTSTGKLMEGVHTASFAQFDNDVRSVLYPRRDEGRS